MLYANELIHLMGAYPQRDWRAREIINYVSRGRELSLREKQAMRKAVLRALQALSDVGVIVIRPPRAIRGGYAQYRWVA